MKKILITAFALSLAVPALAAQQDIAQISAVTASREALRTAVNTQLSAVQANFDEVYAVIDAGPVYVNASAPADTKVVWIDTDQSNAIKVYVGGVWTVVGSGGEGSYTLPTAAADTLGGVKVGARLTITEGVLSADVQTGDGSATYPSAAGVANWGGSAWGTSYTVGTAANNLVQLNASAQLPAVSADLLTITDTNSRFTTDTVGAALVQIGEFNASLPSLVFGTGLTLTEDTPSAGTDTISISANTYQAYDADWLGITPNGADLVSAANYAAMRTLLDLEAGADFNTYDADLTTWAGITPGAGVGTMLAIAPGSAGGPTTTIASGTSALGTSAISSGTCASVVTTTATNVATTDVINWGFNGDPTGVTGYAPSANGMLTIIAYPSSGNVNYKVCNNTAASITPGAITLNWRVQR